MNVFISHSHKDKDIVHRLAHHFEAQGIHVWLDENMIAPGQVWADKLSSAMAESDAIIIVLSKNTAQSKWQSSEIAFAVSAQLSDTNKRLIPVVIDSNVEIPFFLRDRVYSDLSSDEKYLQNFPQLLNVLQSPAEHINLKRVEKTKIEAINAERNILKKEIEAQIQIKSILTTTFLASLASIVVASMSLLAAFVKIVEWNFVIGFTAGIFGTILFAMVFLFVSRKSRHKEARDADR